MKRNQWDVVIIGGGLAGYVAANELARSNFNVLILERGKHVGGRAQTDVMNKQYLNLGPHALYKKGKAKPILEDLGVSLNGNTPKLGGDLVEEHTTYAAPFSPLGLVKTNLLTWKERMEWIRILSRLNTIPLASLDRQTFQQWVRQTAKSDNVRSLLYGLGRTATYCHVPEKTSAKIIVSHLQRVLGGVLYLDGGWQTMVDQLHNKAVVSGVNVQNQANVKQILSNEANDIQLVLSNRETIETKQVLCTAGPHELNKMIGQHAQYRFFEQMQPVKAATLDVALKKLPHPKRLFGLGLTSPLYYSVHSHYARLSEDGQSVILHVLKYKHPDAGHTDGKTLKAELERFLDRMQPGWKQHEITSRFMSDITVNQRLPQTGDEYQLRHCETSVPNVFIAGDWTSPHSILADGAVSSAKQAADEITRKGTR